MKPIKPLRERKKPGVLSQAELYAQVKDSTERNRQFFFIWIAFALYVIVTTVATTDLQLLLPNSTVILPALGIQLPLIGFFLVTPWLVLILHFNLLQNLDSHANKLAEWANTYPNQTPPRSTIPAFLFDFALLEDGGAFPRLTQIAAQLVFYAAGPLTIGILLWRFSDYQDLAYTEFQLAAFVISMVFVVAFTMKLKRKHRLKVSISYFSYFVVYFSIVVMVAMQTGMVIHLTFGNSRPLLFGWLKYDILLPRIKIPQNTSLVNLPTDLPSRMALDGKKDVLEWWRSYGVRADLKGRSLKYASLLNADLRRANLEMAQLVGADLRFAKLQGANLIDARLNYANLDGAQLQDAAFHKAKLAGASLREAQLHGTHLIDISIDKLTNFQNSFTNEQTIVLHLLGNTGAPNAEKSLIFRKQIRDENSLILPNILYEQLLVVDVINAKPSYFESIISFKE